MAMYKPMLRRIFAWRHLFQQNNINVYVYAIYMYVWMLFKGTKYAY